MRLSLALTTHIETSQRKVRNSVLHGPLYDEIRVATLWSPHSPPSHISKMVLPTVQLGPPNWTKSRTFTLRFRLAV